MREYGRWIKNIAAFFLLMALLSLLLPFCRFQAAGEKVELSGRKCWQRQAERELHMQT